MGAGLIDGIHAIAVPTPFAIGPVNAYLIEDDPLTLVDSGPDWATALRALERGLAELGHTIEDLELLVVTHQHADHLGLTTALVERSGAKVACLDCMAPYVRAFRASAQRDDEVAAELMLRHGVPPEVVAVLRSVTTVIRRYGATFDVDVELAPGSLLELGRRRLRVLHRPGHSPTDTVFEDERNGVLLVGDHLLADVSSNALIAYPLGDDRSPGEVARARPRALRAYLRSLEATRASDAGIVLTGHGPPVRDHGALIAERLARHEQRAAAILEHVRAQPVSAHEIAWALWDEKALTQAYLTISEVLGHMDLLIERGQVVEEDGGAVTRFRAA